MQRAQSIAGQLNHGLERIAAAISLLLGLALITAVIINVANVVARYGFNNPISGADEVEVFLMVGLAFLGAVVAAIRQRHLRMDVIARRFPPMIARLVNAAESLATIAVCGLMSWVSFSYTSRIWRLGNLSDNAHIPMWIPHSLLAISFALMTVISVLRLFVAAPRVAAKSEAAE